MTSSLKVYDKWYQSRVLAATNNQNQAIEEEIKKQLKMIKITLAKLKESTERMTKSMERQEILLTNVEEILKEEEEQEQPQNDEVQELEVVLATDARSDVRLKEIVKVSREKAPQIGESQLVTAIEKNAITRVKDLKVPEESREHHVVVEWRKIYLEAEMIESGGNKWTKRQRKMKDELDPR
jgi:ribosomal protein L21